MQQIAGGTDCRCSYSPVVLAHRVSCTPSNLKGEQRGRPSHLWRNLLDKSAVALRAFGHQRWHRELSLAGVAVQGRHGAPSSCLTYITNSSLSGGRTEAPAAVSRHLLQLRHWCRRAMRALLALFHTQTMRLGSVWGCGGAAGGGRGSEFAAGQQEWAPRSVRQAARVRGRLLNDVLPCCRAEASQNREAASFHPAAGCGSSNSACCTFDDHTADGFHTCCGKASNPAPIWPNTI